MLGAVFQVVAAVCVIATSACKWLWSAWSWSSADAIPPPTTYTQATLPSTWELFLQIARVQWKHFWRPASERSLRLPSTRLHLFPLCIDPVHLASYNTLCGFDISSPSTFVPLTYPLILLFKLQSLLLLDDAFPFPGLGLVHLSNTIEQRQQVAVDSSHTYQATVYCEEDLRKHKKGYCFTVVSELFIISTQSGSDSKELVWSSRSTVLSQCGHSTAAEEAAACEVTPYVSTLPETQLKACAGEATWEFGEDVGRKFAALSSDYNPIHVHRLTAALFGFTRGHIIHGMCTCARALATIQCEDGKPTFFVNKQEKKGTCGVVTFYVEFKTPVYLPAGVMLQTAPKSNGDSSGMSGVNAIRNPGGGAAETCFLRVMSAKKRDLPHVKGFLSYTTLHAKK